jgi:hypothetical protein
LAGGAACGLNAASVMAAVSKARREMDGVFMAGERC